MSRLRRIVGRAAFGALLVGAGACAQTGGLGDVLGGVLNPAPADQVYGTVEGVDTRSQQIFVRTQDNQSVGVYYDTRTQVVYNQQSYPVTALERGDQVTMRLASSGNGYYTDYVQVQQAVNGTAGGSTGGGTYQTVSGTVRQVDTRNGWFTMSTQYNGLVQVTLPYNVGSSDLDRFRRLRAGDYVSVVGQYVNQDRLELVRFR
jgi:hypothetical protein